MTKIITQEPTPLDNISTEKLTDEAMTVPAFFVQQVRMRVETEVFEAISDPLNTIKITTNSSHREDDPLECITLAIQDFRKSTASESVQPVDFDRLIQAIGEITAQRDAMNGVKLAAQELQEANKPEPKPEPEVNQAIVLDRLRKSIEQVQTNNEEIDPVISAIQALQESNEAIASRPAILNDLNTALQILMIGKKIWTQNRDICHCIGEKEQVKMDMSIGRGPNHILIEMTYGGHFLLSANITKPGGEVTTYSCRYAGSYKNPNNHWEQEITASTYINGTKGYIKIKSNEETTNLDFKQGPTPPKYWC